MVNTGPDATHCGSHIGHDQTRVCEKKSSCISNKERSEINVTGCDPYDNRSLSLVKGRRWLIPSLVLMTLKC